MQFTALHCTNLLCTTLLCAVMHCSPLFYNAMHCFTALCCTVVPSYYLTEGHCRSSSSHISQLRPIHCTTSTVQSLVYTIPCQIYSVHLDMTNQVFTASVQLSPSESLTILHCSQFNCSAALNSTAQLLSIHCTAVLEITGVFHPSQSSHLEEYKNVS